MTEVKMRKEMLLEMKLVFQCMEVVLEAAQTGSTGDKHMIDVQSCILDKTSNISRMHNLIALMKSFLAFV